MDLAKQLVEAQEYARWRAAKILRRCPDYVDDVLQTAAMKALAHAKDFRGACQFRVWFTSIAINEALYHLRRGKQDEKRLVSMDVPPSEDLDVFEFPCDSASPEEEAVGSELHRVVALEASKMTPILRSELQLMLMGVGTAKDNNRKSRRHRVRRTLRKALKERGML